MIEELFFTNLFSGGDHGAFDGAAYDLFDLFNLVFLTEVDQADADAAFVGATGTAAAVHIGLDVVGEIVINDMRQFLDVDTACSHVGGDKQLEAAFAEVVHDVVAHGLREVAMEGGGVVAVLDKAVGNLLGLQFSAAEDDAIDRWCVIDDALEHRVAVFSGHHVVAVVDVSGARVAFAHGHLHGIGHVLVEDGFHLFRHGGREEHGVAAFLGHVFEDVVNFLLEAHVEHLIGLVEDHGADIAEVDAVASDHVAQAAGCGHDDLRLLGQVFELQFDAGAAVDRHNENFGDVLRVVAEVLGDLHTELTRRTEDQRLHGAL